MSFVSKCEIEVVRPLVFIITVIICLLKKLFEVIRYGRGLCAIFNYCKNEERKEKFIQNQIIRFITIANLTTLTVQIYNV
jgi:hypothetical protein